jgi:aminoglycoside 6'-N-acetyltransferase I
MRRALWDDCPYDQQVREMDEILASDTEEVFVAERPGGGLCGFVEASVRPIADGCSTHPVGYVEGWFVDGDLRRQGVGRALMAAALDWCRSRGYAELASDAQIANETSIRAHLALGYELVERIVCFRKEVPR